METEKVSFDFVFSIGDLDKGSSDEILEHFKSLGFGYILEKVEIEKGRYTYKIFNI